MTKITSIRQTLGEDAADHKDDPEYLNDSIDDVTEQVVQQWEQFGTATLFHEDHAKEADHSTWKPHHMPRTRGVYTSTRPSRSCAPPRGTRRAAGGG